MIDRRRFLIILGGAVAAAGAADPFPHPVLAVPVEGPGAMRVGMAGSNYTFFTLPEVEFIKAAVGRLIPADELGPGAVEADVPYFIDQQLMGAWGAGARYYNQGPFGSQTPYQGYQLPLSPAELYRVGIAATDEYCRQSHGKRFAELDTAAQDQVLSGLQGIAGDVDLKEIPGTAFFARLLTDTMDGFFADPSYGGNKNMIGWKLVGFPGVADNYSDAIGRHNEPANLEPAGIRTAQQQARFPSGSHGHAAHVRINPADSLRTSAPAAADRRTDVAYVWSSGQRIFV